MKRGFLALLLLAAMVLGAVQQPQQASAQSCTWCPAYVTEALNLRATPSTAGSVLTVMPAGATPVWSPADGTTSTGYVRVSYGNYTGWAFADYLLLYPAYGYSTTAVNLRSGAGTGYGVLLVIPSGGSVTVLSGPTSNGWYNVQYGTVAGYMIGTYLAFQDNNVSFYPGERPYTTASLRLRSGAGTGYSTIAVLPSGTRVTILSGPIFANTYGWYRVSTPYGTGWVAGDYLQ
ncbi:MAG: SH3 domain-containing protein [Thermomicrobiales bacterium]|nr:SH3 domain-containing protein [Thermomicrobiales bacterium]